MIGLFDLQPAERAKRYRELAEEVSRQADKSTEWTARQSYTLVAEQWRRRADAVERNALKWITSAPLAPSGAKRTNTSPRC